MLVLRMIADMCLVIGTLKGYDQLMNLVLDEVKEAMTGRQQKDASCRVMLNAL